MYFSKSSLLAFSVAALSALSAVAATPIPCSDATRDLVLRGDLDPSACCSYGQCKGDVNISGA
ncbi:hypothetical protein LSUE1_G008436 [Lachnellula suecica]|uniref:Cerato-ulmin n=1 Tax=Lachnellula suecica TaxID=602035 RepID=A0A8T9BUX7_9HELO|nr:hypothetical protein LSUE1_G008436 [Lachnellula suecica]